MLNLFFISLARKFFNYDDQVLSCDIQESDLVAHVEGLSKQLWCLDQMYPKVGHGGLTLLHLVSALGLAKLISVLIRWRYILK